MLDIARGFCGRQRIEVVTRDHPLRQLFQLGSGQHAAQLGLTDQHDLQQLAVIGFQVGQQTQLFQHTGRQILRLVDDQHIVFASGVRLQQIVIECIDIDFDAFNCTAGNIRSGWQFDPKLVADRPQ